MTTAVRFLSVNDDSSSPFHSSADSQFSLVLFFLIHSVRLTSNSLLDCFSFHFVSFPCHAVVYCFVVQFMLLAGLQFVRGAARCTPLSATQPGM